jgi:hypothetical protein
MVEDVHFEVQHCCATMDRILERGQSALFYKSNIREYRIWEIIVKKKSIKLGLCNAIRYCPWCSSRLPESLGDEIEEVLAQEFNITKSWDPEQAKRIPAEFKTDEWWKKRGL